MRKVIRLKREAQKHMVFREMVTRIEFLYYIIFIPYKVHRKKIALKKSIIIR